MRSFGSCLPVTPRAPNLSVDRQSRSRLKPQSMRHAAALVFAAVLAGCGSGVDRPDVSTETDARPFPDAEGYDVAPRDAVVTPDTGPMPDAGQPDAIIAEDAQINLDAAADAMVGMDAPAPDALPGDALPMDAPAPDAIVFPDALLPDAPAP